jgi:hypothetical protein
MNATTFFRLMWKEYRTVRLFWLSVVVLVGLIQWLIVSVSRNQATTLEMVYNFALGAPAFFAIGCAGAAFAAEREEGTFDFLRASPVSSVQVLASKLTLVTLATAAMFFALLPMAQFMTGFRLTDIVQWQGMLGLWLVAAVEAIAWGTLFSLLGARPLLAVVLALVAASTSAHFLAWKQKEVMNSTFELSAYLRAAPWRGLLALVILSADVYLGLRWLDGDSRRKKKLALSGRRTPATDSTTPTALTPVLSQREREKELQPLLVRRDRSAMLGHLLWQHWRQSWRMMLTMGILFPPVSLLGGGLWRIVTLPARPFFTKLDEAMLVPVAVFATLMGAMVFLPDQEQRRYRFFSEHNVPPRLVWLARQIPWLVILFLSASALCLAWVFILEDGNELLRIVELVSAGNPFDSWSYGIRLPPVGLGIAVVAVAYAAGQWVSILVRSGIMAGFLGLIFSGLLCGWVALMHAMQVSFLWSVWPIPLALIWGTWLRAPDWIGENKRWSARGRLAAALLIPAIPLLIAVPVFRVHQVPIVSPGFDSVQYEAEIKANLAAGTITADMYRRASELLTNRPMSLEDFDSESAWKERETARPPVQADQDWLKKNSAALALLLKASERPICIFGDPRKAGDWPNFNGQFGLPDLMLVSARQLEGEGKLDAALDRYFATLHVAAQLNEVGRNLSFPELFRQLAYWGPQKGQTPERIAGALKRLQAIDSRFLRLDENLESDFILGERAAMCDPTQPRNLMRFSITDETLWLKLMPWESARALRVLNLLSQTALQRLQEMRLELALTARGKIDSGKGWHIEGGVRDLCEPGNYTASPSAFFELGFQSRWQYARGRARSKEADWLESTVPDLSGMGYAGFEAANTLAAFETQRRAAMIVLALESFQLDHGELPKSLAELKGRYLAAVPLDPYSGLEFQYFPSGLPAPKESVDDANFVSQWRNGLVRPGGPIDSGVPGVWSTGPELAAETDTPTRPVGTVESVTIIGYSYRLRPGERTLPSYAAWGYGYWFQIPDKRPK